MAMLSTLDPSYSRHSVAHACTLHTSPTVRPPRCMATCAGFVFTPVYAPTEDAEVDTEEARLSALSLAARAAASTPYGVSIHLHAPCSAHAQVGGNEALAAAAALSDQGPAGAANTEELLEPGWIIGGHEHPVQALAAVQIRRPIRYEGDDDGDDDSPEPPDHDEEGEFESDVLLVSSSADRVMLFYMSEVLSCLCADPAQTPAGRVLPLRYDASSMELDASGTRLAICLASSGVVVIDLSSGTVEAMLEGHIGRVNGASFLPAAYIAQSTAAAAAGLGLVGASASDFPDPLLSAACILTYGQDRTLKFWDLSSRRMLYTSSIVSSSPFVSHCWDLGSGSGTGTSPSNARQARFCVGSEDGKMRHYECSKIIPHVVYSLMQVTAAASGAATSVTAQSLGAVGAPTVRLIHTLDIGALQRKLCRTHETAAEESRRRAAHAAAQGKVIRAGSGAGAAPEPLYKPYLATEANAPGYIERGDDGEGGEYGDDADAVSPTHYQSGDAPPAIIAMYYPVHVNARGDAPAMQPNWPVPPTPAASVPAPAPAKRAGGVSAAAPRRSPSASPSRSPSASPGPASGGGAAACAAGPSPPSLSSLSSTTDTLYVVTSRGLSRVNTRTYELEWSASFTTVSNGGAGGGGGGGDGPPDLNPLSPAIASPAVPNLTLLPGVGLSNLACFMESESMDELASSFEMFLLLASPFVAQLSLLKLSIALTPWEARASAARPSIHPVGPLPKNSPLRQWQWAPSSASASGAGAKSKKKAAAAAVLAAKKGLKPGQVGAPTSHNIVFHTRIKSSGYGGAPGTTLSKGSAPPRQLQLGGLHQKSNTTAGRMNQQAQRRAASASSSSSSSAPGGPERRYPLDCGPINVLSVQSAQSTSSKGGVPPLHNGPIVSLSWSHDAKRVLSASLDSTACSVRVPPWKHPQGATHLLGHKKPVRSAAWAWVKPGSASASQQQKESDVMVLTSSSDATARLWQLGRAEPLLVFDHLKRNEAAVAASSSASASAAPAASDNPLFTTDISACSFFRQNQLILLSHRNQLLCYKYYIDPARTNTDLRKLQNHNQYRLLVAHTPSAASHAITTFACVNSFLSTLVIAGDSARNLHLIDMAAPGGGKVVRSVPDAHAKPVHAVVLNAPSAFLGPAELAASLDSQQLFATAATDSAIKLWDVRTKDCVRRFSGHVNRSAPVRMSFSPCGRYLASGSEDNRAYVFDMRSGSIVDKLGGATDVVSDVAYNPLHPQLATSCYDGRIRFYSCA